MKMKQKRIHRIITFIISIVIIISCQDSQYEILPSSTLDTIDDLIEQTSTENPSVLDSEKNDQVQTTIGKGLQIEFWHPWSGDMAEIINKLAAEYNSENPWSNEIQSKSHADQDILIEDITELFQTDEDVPDLVVSSSQSLQTWYSNGYSIRELDGLLQLLEKEDSKNGIPEIFPVFWNVDDVNGKKIGIPAYESGQFLFYNQTWGEELGFDTHPQSTGDFREQTCLAEKTNRFDEEIENNGTGGWIYSLDSLSLLSWLRAFGGGELVNSRFQPILSEPENIEALQYLYDIYLEDCAWSGKQQLPYSYFLRRNALLYSGQMEDIIRQLQIDYPIERMDIWKLIPYPSPSGKPILMVKGLSFAFTSEDNERVTAALDFVRWVLQPEQQVEIIEDTGAFPLSNDVIERIDTDLAMFPIWFDSLQYLPYAQPEPSFEDWYVMEKVLEDVGWQLIQFTMQPENIGDILTEAEDILGEVKETIDK
jgi:multiple sugar transport system substrate-binding protein